MSAAWSSGRSRLWLTLAVLVTFWIALFGENGLGGAGFIVIHTATAFLPAWACADLLATRFRENPDPLREWHPREFLARAAARLLPIFVIVSLWTGIYLARAIEASLGRGFGVLFCGIRLDGTTELRASWLAMTAALVLKGAPYAAWAALLSALARRPRRAVVAAFAFFLGSLLPLLFFSRAAGVSVLPPLGLLQFAPEQWQTYVGNFVSAPGFWLGMLVQDHLDGLASAFGLPPGHGPTQCWMIGLAALAHAVPAVLGVWWVAHRRYHRYARVRARAAAPA